MLACTRALRSGGGAAVNAFGSSLPAVVSSVGWEGAWAKGTTPWDAGACTPLIPHLLSHGSLPAGKVLVPGCGAGYDAVAFALAGRDVTGVDCSPTAVRTATNAAKHGTIPRSIAAAGGKCTFQVADFFTLPRAPYGVVFDYTFMSALPPSMWDAWAASMKRLLALDGQLVTLMFPIGDFKGGPPFATQPETVKALLERNDFECVEMAPVAPELSHKARAGREWLGRWRLTTHRYPIIHNAAYLPKKVPSKKPLV